MEKWLGKVAVVTGVSSGIGAAVATQLVEAGLKVVGLARRKEKCEELSKALAGKRGEFVYVTADVSKEDDVLRAYEWIERNVGPVHILVNNAGVTRATRLVDGETNLWKEVLDTNVLGLCMMTREAVRNMRKNNVDGHIVHINSLSGHRIAYFPTLNVYPASKYAVTALTETLRQELNSIGSKIKISSVSPGVVDTEMLKVGAIQDYAKLAIAANSSMLKPQDIADSILYILSTPPHVQIHDVIIRPQGQST